MIRTVAALLLVLATVSAEVVRIPVAHKPVKRASSGRRLAIGREVINDYESKSCVAPSCALLLFSRDGPP